MTISIRKRTIVVIEKDLELQKIITSFFSKKGYDVINFSDPFLALDQKHYRKNEWDIILTNFNFAHISEEDFRNQIKKELPNIPIILINPSSEKNQEDKSLYSLPPNDFLSPSLLLAPLEASIEKELNWGSSERVSKREQEKHGLIIGQSPIFLKALNMARKVANSTASIFINGESGSGKEIFAKYIHNESNRKKGPFIAINCSAIPETLLESELFGHARGSFTGAVDKKIGLFEAAEDGTLFLDEIGDLSFPLQAKLLRVLQEKTIKRVGENINRPINCRIISATHKDLSLEVNEFRFREDLFFRLNVIPIYIPPLRDRKEDIIPLAEAFLKKYALKNNFPVKHFSKEALNYILNNQWRGNVRELENAIERAVILCEGTEVSIIDFIPSLLILNEKKNEMNIHHQCDHIFSIQFESQLPLLEEIIQKYIEFAVDKNGGARDKTAKEIGIDRKTLYKRIKTTN